ncbi:hypothetical protein MAIC_29740 [Mycolicibacterium aichiense]|uniref:Uncharacterized protein n=1 Tax=Mycolicibacterium aichiense TaxID=1799 RepID=A0AAD1HN99_9MYCO|nr:hypothetical protein MAIC_29740 [Mycolicibacterium aichiense]
MRLKTALIAHALEIQIKDGTSSCPQSIDGVNFSNALLLLRRRPHDARSAGFPANLPRHPGEGARVCQMTGEM